VPSADGGPDGDQGGALKIVAAHFRGEPVQASDDDLFIRPGDPVGDGDRRVRGIGGEELLLYVGCQAGAEENAQRGLVLGQEGQGFLLRHGGVPLAPG
jgi:hypothetical protein